MGVTYNPKIVTNGLLLSIDFANPKTYISGTTANSTVTPYTFTFKNGATYNTVTNGVLTTTRAATVTTKANDGGGMQATVSGSLAVATFMYNDHTWEVWVKINDAAAANYDANESLSHIAGYAGYNNGFTYNATTMYYNIWNGITNNVTCATFAIGSAIIVGNWHQIVVTRSGSTFTTYVNGVPGGTGSTNSPSSVGVGTSNVLGIGSHNLPNYIWYAKMSFSNTKMYNRALSAEEVLRNFNAVRGRFGI